MLDRYPYYLAGRPSLDGATLPVLDKFSGATATHVTLAGPDAIERAIAAAADAARPLREMSPHARQAVLEHCVRRFRERAEELAEVLCVEAGKPIRDSRGEVTRLIDTFKVAAEEATRIDGETLTLAISPRTEGYRGFTKRVPIGPCSFITPFNFPLNLVAHKVAPAIAAGCPFVLKPSERTPVSALILGEILAETGLPPGSFSVVPCALDHLTPLVEDERLAMLSFTGSGPVGWKLRSRAGRKKVVLELGGNASCIVDADQGGRLDAIVDRLVFGAYYQSGQSCVSVQHILVHESLHAALREKLVAKVGVLVAGDPHDEKTFVGPMIDEAAASRLEGWITRAADHGAKVIVGGKRTGAMLEATLVEGVPADEPLSREEAFGPVALLSTFSDFGEAIRRVNSGQFGLQAGVFTDSLSHTTQAWDELEVGGVIVGDVPSFRVDNMPYGGVKGSGVGREGVRWSIEEMTEVRLLVVRDAPRRLR